MGGRAVMICASVALLGAMLATGCSKRTLDSPGSGTGGSDASGIGGGGARGGGSGTGGGGSGAGGNPPGDLAIGQACTSATECATTFCVDGVCCNAACAGSCVSCVLPGSVGTCAPVAINTTCGAGACDGDTVVGQMACDGRGSCRAAATTICVPYHCDPVTASCQTTCASDADCTNSYCQTDGHCRRRFLPANCSSNLDCASGFCVRGVCCDSACGDPCMACNLPNHEGTCSPMPGGCPTFDAGSD